MPAKMNIFLIKKFKPDLKNDLEALFVLWKHVAQIILLWIEPRYYITR